MKFVRGVVGEPKLLCGCPRKRAGACILALVHSAVPLGLASLICPPFISAGSERRSLVDLFRLSATIPHFSIRGWFLLLFFGLPHYLDQTPSVEPTQAIALPCSASGCVWGGESLAACLLLEMCKIPEWRGSLSTGTLPPPTSQTQTNE